MLLTHIAQSYTKNYQRTGRGRDAQRNKSPLSRLGKSKLRTSSAKGKRKVLKLKELPKAKPIARPRPITAHGHRPVIPRPSIPTVTKLSAKESTKENTNPIVKCSVHSSISEPHIKVKPKESDSSFDSDYLRENFVISSSDLYGAEDNGSGDEGKREEQNSKKYDYMPLIYNAERADGVRAVSSTGRRN